MSRFVGTGTRTLTLANGDWIEVKERLPVGEKKRVDSSGLKRVVAADGKETKVETDFAEFSLARLDAYIVRWSLRDADGKIVEKSRAAIEALDEADFEEMETALQKHIKEIADSKKIQAGEPQSKAS